MPIRNIPKSMMMALSNPQESPRNVRRLLLLTLLWVGGAFVALVPHQARAGSTVQVGISSDLLVHEGKVHFAQADGSLTILDARTGSLLKRVRGDFRGEMEAIPEGLLVTQYRGWMLYDWNDFKSLKVEQRAYQAEHHNGVLIEGDGNGRFQAHVLTTGKTAWTFHHPGAVRKQVSGEHVLFLCTGTYGYGDPLLALLDLRSGREIYREVPEEGVTHEGAYIYGDQLIVIEGAFDPVTEPRERSVVKRLVRLDLQGQFISANHEVPEDVQRHGRWSPSGVVWEGLFFHNDKGDRVVILPSEQAPVQPGAFADLGWGTAEYDSSFFLRGGQLVSWKVSHWDTANNSQVLHLLELRGRNNWWSVLPTVKLPRWIGRESLVAVAEWEETLIVGTNYGRVECLRKDTGESLWTYIFPFTRFYGGVRGPIPYRSDLARAHRERNQRLDNPGMFTPLAYIERLNTREAGRQVLRLMESPPAPAQIHYDPLPGPWFKWLWLQQILAWAVAFAILGANILLLRRAWRERAALPGVMWLALLLGMASGLTLVFVGWIDRPSHGGDTP